VLLRLRASIDIVKLTTARTPTTLRTLHPVGDPVTWTYRVTNTGNVTLTNVTVTDDMGVTVTLPKTTLAPVSR